MGEEASRAELWKEGSRSEVGLQHLPGSVSEEDGVRLLSLVATVTHLCSQVVPHGSVGPG